MKTFVFILLLLVSTFASAQFPVEVNVPPGDLDALRLAMTEAAAGDPSVETIILTSGTFNFTDAVGLPDVRTRILIRGLEDPITFLYAGYYGFAPLVRITEAGRLQIQNIELKNFILYGGGGLFVNQGTLEFLQVQFDSVAGDPRCTFGLCSPNPTIINNLASGQLLLEQVSLINSGVRAQGIPVFNLDGILRNYGSADVQNSQIYFSDDHWSTPIVNRETGILSLKNVSMFHSNYDRQFSIRPISTGSVAKTYVSNTIFSGFSGKWCETATSLGNNLIDDDQCNFNAEGDVIGEPAGLFWQPVQLQSWSWNASSLSPILTHALVPVQTSPAVDRIDPALCPRGDLVNSSYSLRMLDGNDDGEALCDMGAVELPPVHIANGGINGVYYNPDADGHYITIIDNPYNTLVMWNSFDKNGNQYFVSGTGQLVAGRTLIADAYTTIAGSTSPDGEILPAQAVHWGTLEVDMISCNEGALIFHSDFPEFGSGQLRLVRLVFVKQLGCVD